MDIKQIKNMGRELNKFLEKFNDCFSRSESRQNLRTYIKGQLSLAAYQSTVSSYPPAKRAR